MFAAAALACAIAACDSGGDEGGGDSGGGTSAIGEFGGGDTTVFILTSNAFSMPAPNLDAATLGLHLEGDFAFEQSFVSAGNPNFPGLGPIFNTTSCEGCHPKDGRGKPPDDGPEPSLLIRLSIPGTAPNGGPMAVPGFGGQLQDNAIFGVTPEALKELNYTAVNGTYGDGTPYVLRRPTFTLGSPYVALPGNLMISPRVAPPVFGLGLLEALDEATILALADPTDANGDGISGRVNMVWDVQAGAARLGRFGWKANTPNLLQQSAAAYVNDMGVTSPLFSNEPFLGQPQDDGLPDDPEIDQHTLDITALYVRTLGVPARRNVNDPQVLRGETLFTQAGCAGCHKPALVTGNTHPLAELRNQTIHPFTDLLVHDMGADLADNRSDFLADGQEWRTAPLWGIGMTSVVNGHTFFLHDGRARNLAEAILWHGGEALNSRDAFRNMNASDRAALIAFLNSN
ncbi:MAG: c-type cytochrome [Planctomycetes bacterium]|nr:c-type cytochrome [Planctomycetota bacterium]